MYRLYGPRDEDAAREGERVGTRFGEKKILSLNGAIV